MVPLSCNVRFSPPPVAVHCRETAKSGWPTTGTALTVFNRQPVCGTVEVGGGGGGGSDAGDVVGGNVTGGVVGPVVGGGVPPPTGMPIGRPVWMSMTLMTLMTVVLWLITVTFVGL